MVVMSSKKVRMLDGIAKIAYSLNPSNFELGVNPI
jgi:hypothetical protein